uniref:Uncharacterized protein n=1 Tax=Anguilla anguilla TaxID=7936 RepID=A0A0E9X4F1_ANGAN
MWRPSRNGILDKRIILVLKNPTAFVHITWCETHGFPLKAIISHDQYYGSGCSG